jgi:phosphoribosylglycinamide formyltransferase-1
LLQIAVLISGGGSNLQTLIDAVETSGNKIFNICTVIADRNATGIQRAKKAGIKTYIIDRKFGSEKLSSEINEILKGKADYIVLAGFLSILDKSFIKKWEKKIINIHPSLLPDFGGKGMYGKHVHEAVIKSGTKKSGCTVHYVDTGIDTGEIIKQKILEVNSNWDAEKLQEEVLKLEHILLPETVLFLSEKGKIK